MKRILFGVTLAAAASSISGPVWAQAAWPAATSPPLAYAGARQAYPFQALTPSDAYRQGLINRWELERYEGPTPQALQGPSPDGGNHGGGDNRSN